MSFTSGSAFGQVTGSNAACLGVKERNLLDHAGMSGGDNGGNHFSRLAVVHRHVEPGVIVPLSSWRTAIPARQFDGAQMVGDRGNHDAVSPGGEYRLAHAGYFGCFQYHSDAFQELLLETIQNDLFGILGEQP
jgi:hypothetical protein